MASFAGLSLRSAGERAYDRRSAEAELADIERGEEAFLRAVDVWARKHHGDRDAIFNYLGDFLCDYFHGRRRDAAEELGLDADEADNFGATRDRMIATLVAGGRL
ncbi:MAG: hypothetical protein IVW56_09480 [Candidatus Binataceae bacterium]|nr:hypothetical protein [Candidatus Binataceae bacterium]